MQDSQEISTDLSSLRSRLGLQEILSNFNGKKNAPLKNLENRLRNIFVRIHK